MQTMKSAAASARALAISAALMACLAAVVSHAGTWSSRIDEPWSQELVDIVPLDNGLWVGCGGDGASSFVAAFDAVGGIPWAVQFTHPDLWLTSLTRLPGGDIVVAGTIWPPTGNSEVFLARLSAGGAIAWERTMGGTEDEMVFGVEATRNGEIFVAAQSRSYGSGNYDAWLLRVRDDGSIVWQEAIGSAAIEYPWAAKEAPDGTIWVVGSAQAYGAGGGDAWILRLDAAGTILSQVAVGGAGGDQATAVDVGPDGTAWVAGVSSSCPGGLLSDAYVASFDPGGNLSWARTFGVSGSDRAAAIVATSPCGAFLAGHFDFAPGSGAEGDAFLAHVSSGGDASWVRRYDAGLDESVASLVLAPDGGLIAAGYTDTAGISSRDPWILRTDAAGGVDPSCGVPLSETISTAPCGDVVTITNAPVVSTNAVSTVLAPLSAPWAPTSLLACMGDGGGFSGTGQRAYIYPRFTGELANLQETSDGGFIFSTTIWTGTSASSPAIVRTDAMLMPMWAVRVDTSSLDRQVRVQALAETPDCGFLVAGHQSNPGGTATEGLLLKLDGSGAPQWGETLARFAVTTIFALTVDDLGTAFVAGTASYSPWLAVVDPMGGIVASRCYRQGSVSGFQSIERLMDGRLVGTFGGSPAEGVAVVKSDLSLVWMRRAPPLAGSTYLRTALQLAQGDIAFVIDNAVHRFDLAGTQLGSVAVLGLRNDDALGAAVMPDGGLALAGMWFTTPTLDIDFPVVKLDRSLAFHWASDIGTDIRSEFTGREALIPTSGGGLAAGGFTDFGGGASGPWLLKLNEMGMFDSDNGCATRAALAVNAISRPFGSYVPVIENVPLTIGPNPLRVTPIAVDVRDGCFTN